MPDITLLQSTETRLFAAALFMVCVIAAIWGRTVERRGAALFMIAWAASALSQVWGRDYTPQTMLAAVDAAVFLGLAALAWKAPFGWPAAAAGLQAIALAAHVAFALGLTWMQRPYLTVLGFVSCAQLVLLAVAVIVGRFRHKVV